MRFSVLASGSGGNACYVETNQTRVIIDAGLSGRELIRRLEFIDVDPNTLDALVITHEHTDHIRGAGPLSRRLNLPVYINASTLRRGMKTLGNIACPVTVHTGQTLTIGDLLIETFTKCHDAADPMGLVVASDGVRLGLITDLGRTTSLVEDRLKGCRAVILEFNHDEVMLDRGPYPLALKRRIKGPDGHLSNRQAGELLKAVSHSELELVVLAHMSETNNHPDRAYQEARNALARCGRNSTRIELSRQDEPQPMIEIV